MNRVSLIAGAVTALGVSDGFVLRAVPDRASDLVGEWRGETYAAGSTADFTLTFFPNGTYSKRIAATTEYGWSLEGKLLLLAPAVLDSNRQVSYGKASAVQIKISGDSLIATAGKQSLLLRRVTWPVKETPILGRWEGLSDLNQGITQDFTADGRLLVSVVLTREAGRFSVGDGTITWAEQIPNPGRKRSKYRLEAGKLYLTIAPQIPPIELARVRPDSSSN